MLPSVDAKQSRGETVIPVELRWTDFDGYGHLHTSAHFVTLETARAKFLNSVLHPNGGTAEWILVHIEVDFVGELRWAAHEHASCRIAIEAVGTSSITLAESIEAPPGNVISHTRAVIALWDPVARRTLPLDDNQRASTAALGS
jgi:acyl-CoA thioester hydrolase